MANEKTPTNLRLPSPSLLNAIMGRFGALEIRMGDLETLGGTILRHLEQYERTSKELIGEFETLAKDIRGIIGDHERRITDIEQGCLLHSKPQ